MKELFEAVLDDFIEARKYQFPQHRVYDILNKELPKSLESIFSTEDFKIEGSAGKGKWAAVPWVALMNKEITHSTQRGYFIAYIFKEDMSGFYLTLILGFDDIRKIKGEQSIHILKTYANRFKLHVRQPSPYFQQGPLTIGLPKTTSPYPAYYEAGTLVHRYYRKEKLPTNEILIEDLHAIVKVYDELAALKIDIV